jgi:hypothetical protein
VTNTVAADRPAAIMAATINGRKTRLQPLVEVSPP